LEADGFKMDYGGHDSKFHDNLVLLRTYDEQNCFNLGDFLQGHGDVFYNNKCLLTTDRGPDTYAFFYQCDPSNVAGSMYIQLHDNEYFTFNGKAQVNCGGYNVSLSDLQKAGYDLGSTVSVFPEDAKVVSWAHDLLLAN
jgi:hypothetical protein